MSRNVFIAVALCLVSQVVCQTTLSAGVTVSTASMTSLSYVYYQFICTPGVCNIGVSPSTSISGGDPDIFVSATVTQPQRSTPSSSIVAESTSSGASSVQFYVATPTTYYIGIYASTPSQTGSFDVVASVQTVSITTLTKDTAVNGVVGQGSYDYYMFNTGSSLNSLDDIAVTLTALTGDPDVYVSATNPMPDGQSTWSNTATGSGIAYIPWSNTWSNTGWSNSQTFYVSVRGATSATYTLTWSQSSSSSSGSAAIAAAAGLFGAMMIITIVAPLIIGICVTVLIVWCCCCKKPPAPQVIVLPPQQQGTAQVAVGQPVQGVPVAQPV